MKEIRVGVVGEAGVGKSTLINALISQRLPLLPQGGIGPLTAIPVEVRYASNPFLQVTCLGAARVAEMLGGGAALSRPFASDGPERALRQMAALMATGSQFGQIPDKHLLAFLDACVDEKATGCIPPDLRVRAGRVREVVVLADSGRLLRIEAGTNLPSLLIALAEHGAGFLAPLTAKIEFGWDAPVLANRLTLIDLPGLGVANDIHRLQTLTTTPLQAILLVVDRAGLTDATAAVLRAMISLCGCARGVATPTLLVAATKLDQPAAEAASHSNGVQSWAGACHALAMRASVVISSQLDIALLGAAPTGNSGRQQVPKTDVLPVFPREYQRLHRADPDEPARLDNEEATGIPRLIERLQDLARESKAPALT